MTTALLYGLATALPLVGGAWLGLRWHIPRPLLAALMAFGAGTMIAAASSELFEPAFRSVAAWHAGLALMAGAGTYAIASHLLDTRLGTASVGWGLMLGSLLDGIPENTALGVSLTGSGGIVLLVAIAIGNTPEAIGSAATMRDAGGPTGGSRRILLLWAATGAVLVLVTVGAHALGDSIGSSSVATVQAFAGGATIAVLADTLMPEAYTDGGWWVGLTTALGFFVAFVLGG
ncbi:ZIP family metal transporter [Aeromicrobium sp.]|uniref:ZIP family metal transporter n=1 Tax=Aeromicrobium sp. TaxID=1871063 RepID=UPI003C58C98C